MAEDRYIEIYTAELEALDLARELGEIPLAEIELRERELQSALADLAKPTLDAWQSLRARRALRFLAGSERR